MKLTSPSFNHNGLIPSIYTCDGINCSPPFKIRDVPPNAKSIVLIMDDPDAVKEVGRVWDHWIVFNIPATMTIINKGEQPTGVAGKNSGGNIAYVGPCHSQGEHCYVFKLFALDLILQLSEGATRSQVEHAMHGHVIEETKLAGRYTRR